MKIEELSRAITTLTEELSLRKQQLEATEKIVSTFKDDFSNAYDKGMRANKAIKHEFETNLHRAEITIKNLEERVKSLEQERDSIQFELRKSDRALSSARKVAMVERNFLEVVKKIENKRKEKKLALDKNLKDKAEQDNEEKKLLRTKIKILKEAYNKLNEQYQSSQSIEKELQNKIKECESLKIQLKGLRVPMNQGSTSSPRSALDYSRSSPGQSASPTPIRKSSGQSDMAGSSKSVSVSDKDKEREIPPPMPSIVIQSPTKWNSVDRSKNRGKDYQ
jgi:chromosome segregation ATPase